MAISLTTNIASLQAQQGLGRAQARVSETYKRLSSGFRVTSAADDAASLSISETMKAQVRSYAVAERNISWAFQLLDRMDGAAERVSNIIVRMRELAVQSSNEDLNANDRAGLQVEYSQLQSEWSRIQAGTLAHDGQRVNNNGSGTWDFMVGIDNTSSSIITVDANTDASAGEAANIIIMVNPAFSNISTAATARNVIGYADIQLPVFLRVRAKIGAWYNRFEAARANVETIKHNLSAAAGRMVDADIAHETSELARNQVIVQQAASVLAQANQQPNLALKLIG